MNRKIFFVVILIFISMSLFAKPFVFVQIADPQLGWDGRDNFAKEVVKLDRVVAEVNRIKPEFMVICGDMTNHGNYMSQVDAVKRSLAKLETPVYYVPGNHDISMTPEDIAAYKKNYGNDYYKFSVENNLFIILDMERIMYNNEASFYERVQRNWLLTTLKYSSQYDHIFIVTHRPFFKNDFNEPDSYDAIPTILRSIYFDMFIKYGVDYILSGHTHSEIIMEYKNIKMITNTGLSLAFDKKPDGIRIFKVFDDKVEHIYQPLD